MIPIQTIKLSQNGGIFFTNIPQNFTHLQIRGNGRSVNSGYATIYSGFNGDRFVANNYHNTVFYGDATSKSMAVATAQAFFGPHYFIHSGATANCWNGYIIDILNYSSTSKTKSIRYLSGWDAINAGQIVFGDSVWNSTAAITSFDMEPDAGFLAGSSATLYGIHTASVTT
jgi:hypothetical protein